MGRAVSWLALIIAYTATLFYIAAMVSPWWYTKYYPLNGSNDQFYNANPSLDRFTGLFYRTNCFIDGSCITGGQIYKNNSSLQWVYTATLVLMIVGWIPWLLFVHFLHFRADKNRPDSRAYRPCMFINAFLAWCLITAAVIVFAVGIVKTNGVYNTGGLYGHKQVISQNGFTGIGLDAPDNSNNNNNSTTNNGNSTSNAKRIPSGNFGYTGLPTYINLYYPPVPFGSLPYGNQPYSLLGAGISLLPGVNGTQGFNGTIAYKWGAHAAWYFAIFTLALIPLALILGLLIKSEQRVVTQTRTVERSVANQPAVVGAPAMGYQQPAVLPQTTANRVI